MKAEDLKPGVFNLISAGCGSGKTYWVLNHLLKSFPDVKPYEVVFVTSRSITKDQQARNRGTTKLRRDDSNVLQFWNDVSKNNEDILENYGVILMTYDQMIDAVNSPASPGSEVLQNVKIVIYDECHVLFSDLFINNLNSLRVWTREVIYGARKLFIGLSATTKIIEEYKDDLGVPINRINKVSITGYRAKQLICTNSDTIPYLISANKLPGKTMIMCHSYKLCKEIAQRLSNAAVMVSKNSSDFTDEMRRIRDHIIQYEELPPTFFDDEGNERDLEVLVSTSTLREGFNLKESSGVRNIITCMTDELHIIQFAGRCRYNFDNLVVADTLIFEDNSKQEGSATPSNVYIRKSRDQFKSYMKDKSCVAWFEPIRHLVAHDIYGVKRFVLGSDDNRFINYINATWLVPSGMDKKLQERYRIWKDADKAAIIDMADQCKIFALYKSEITFNRVVRLLQDCLGYSVDSGSALLDGQRKVYKLVVSYDAEAKSYPPAVPTENDGFYIEEE